MNTKLIRRSVLAATVGAASFALVACGSSGHTPAAHEGHGSSATASQDRHNAADLTFTRGMVPHHRQALEMAALAPARAASPEVKEVAAAIKEAQGPEIKTLTGWLASWGEKDPAEGAMDHAPHDMDGTGATDGKNGMDGMMSTEDMAALKKASGKAFDTAFLTMMVQHHKGAVAMARSEKAAGVFPAARKMADSVITSQTAEITRMNRLLGTQMRETLGFCPRYTTAETFADFVRARGPGLLP
ncbi:DUF305 domain-containing protein, partial [Streptomyces sp. NPDC006552]|uniref:DUF305 domain-containing protein n=1 Tax=Streptomyces sp. NPDC006552 TaxID=3157179 RepID=UPI00339E6479